MTRMLYHLCPFKAQGKLSLGFRPAARLVALALILSSDLLLSPSSAIEFRFQDALVTFALQTEPREPRLGLSEMLRVHATLSSERPLEVEWKTPTGAWEIVEAPRATATSEGGRWTWRKALELAPLAPGSQPLTFGPLRYREPDKAWVTIAIPPTAIEVETSIKDADLGQMRDVTGILPTPSDPGTPSAVGWWRWPSVVALIVGAAALGFLLQRRRPDNRQTRTVAEWQRLRARGFVEKGDGRSFAFLFDRLLRRHLARAHAIPATTMTWEALRPILDRGTGISDDERAFYCEVLEKTHRVKFGGETIAVEEMREWGRRWDGILLQRESKSVSRS